MDITSLSFILAIIGLIICIIAEIIEGGIDD